MSDLTPPPLPPLIGPDDDGHIERVRLRMKQVAASMLTLLGAGWICSFGPIPSILALMVAKHILVAVVIMGLGMEK